jgi:hypothetical protein
MWKDGFSMIEVGVIVDILPLETLFLLTIDDE